MKNKVILILLMLIPFFLFSRELNVHDILSMTIPDEFEIISISESLRSHRRSDQYGLRINIEYVYYNKRLVLTLDLFGYGDDDRFGQLADSLGIEETGTYYPEYRTADQKKFLKQNYEETPEESDSGMIFARMVSAWASGWSWDYFGTYFKINNKYFEEAILHSINYWMSFEGDQLTYNDRDFRRKLPSLKPEGEKLYNYLDDIINSISLQPANTALRRNSDLLIEKGNSLPGYWLPSVENLRLREGPSLDSAILGYVRDVPYKIIDVGPHFTTGGIEGRWYRIASFIGTEIGWAFGGLMREMTEEEEAVYFEGI